MFAGSFPRVLTVLSGMTYMEHLDDNLLTYKDFKPLVQEEPGFQALQRVREQGRNCVRRRAEEFPQTVQGIPDRI